LDDREARVHQITAYLEGLAREIDTKAKWISDKDFRDLRKACKLLDRVSPVGK